jgi:hypothetical protein
MASHILWPLVSFDWQVFRKGWSAEKLGKNRKRKFQAASFNKYHPRLSAKRRLG